MSLHRSTNAANYTYPSKMKWLLPAVCVPLGIPPPSSCCGWGTGEQRAAGSTEGALLCSIPQEQRCFNLYPGMIHVNHEQKSSCQDGSKHSPIKLSHGGCSSTTVSLGRRCPFLNKASLHGFLDLGQRKNNWYVLASSTTLSMLANPLALLCRC